MYRVTSFALTLILSLVFLLVSPAFAARDTNSFDGNIFPIYAGNGSLVPPQSTIESSLNNKRTSVIVFYLDDDANSKQFAPVVSGLKLLWTSSIDIIPLTTDELSRGMTDDITNPAYYWHGKIPQLVVLDGEGNILLDEEGQIPIEKINSAISLASGLEAPDFNISIKSFNEYNSDASKDGYTDPR
ncbi:MULTISPECIES: thylakoid membrane photosystem I accumulation factor [Prochlorococcus]|uniref:Thioredoxin family protein n=1 Tax=Prochlorococcus marinus (strain SARG / CCMP1375 / SS120) TaxID=167539 RepID=Q7VC72_PROMA|nr:MULTISPECIES: thylakoid membrane photosystem I accumulation factor [Prochlorococcus]AAP99914.1 Thioredoxin family protein [Prochlorococcus marinus subsp. marinus str. CCMP1375]KGG11738.1 Thioredoxin family protein [Prochlorococcus marinus str. LG]KGG18848.1 Thioredoxin family protein [Prochlorococcus marinus str. SS2]KGG23614.1 Thioredoxin family protein [Prochlorococcus marinus str. SS35]KGG32150.1 Thioredoxin family protein [Prochlorococcus marinus str. SS51]